MAMMLHEKLVQARQQGRSAQWFMENERYADVIDTMAKRSKLSKFKKIDDFDKVVLGQQLLMFENYLGFINEIKGSTAELGKVPEVGLDVVGGLYGDSILPLLGSTYNMPEKVGILWFRQTKAATTRGNLTDGQLIRDPRQASNVYPSGFASGKQDKVQMSTTTAGVTNYNIILFGAPIQPRSVVISIPEMGIYEGIDNGQGKYYGDSTQATITYSNGAIALKLTSTPTGAFPIYVSWITDWETENIIPSSILSKQIFNQINITTGTNSIFISPSTYDITENVDCYIQIDGAGNSYITDATNVVKFDSAGNLISAGIDVSHALSYGVRFYYAKDDDEKIEMGTLGVITLGAAALPVAGNALPIVARQGVKSVLRKTPQEILLIAKQLGLYKQTVFLLSKIKWKYNLILVLAKIFGYELIESLTTVVKYVRDLMLKINNSDIKQSLKSLYELLNDIVSDVDSINTAIKISKNLK